MSRGRLAALVLAAVALLVVHAWLAGALYRHVDDVLYRWTWVEVPFALVGAWATWRDDGSDPAASRRALVAILVVAAILRLVLVGAAPVSSTDIYRYVWDGRVQAAGINPYRYVPADPALAALRDGAIYPFINRATYAHTIYPPVAQMVFFLVTRLSESVAAMKAAMVAAEAAAAWAILRLLARRGLPLSRICIALWHPLPIWEFAGSGHVDALAVGCLFLGLLAAEARRPAFAGAALAGLLLTKVFPVVVGPALYRRWGWRLPLVFAATVVLCYLPYLSVGRGVFGFLQGYGDEEGLRDGSGLWPWLAWRHLVPAFPAAWEPAYPALAALVLAGIGVAVLLRRRDRAASLNGAVVLAVAVTVLASPHYPWYFAWLVPFLAFVPSPAVLWLTTAAPLLEQVEWPGDFALASVLYVPFLVLAGVEGAVRFARSARRPNGDPARLAAG